MSKIIILNLTMITVMMILTSQSQAGTLSIITTMTIIIMLKEVISICGKNNGNLYPINMTIFDIIIPCNALHCAGKDTDAVWS